jgi:hypothetical protein
MSPYRYWPAGAPCPRQVLVLFEPPTFDDEKVSTDPCMDDIKPTNEKNGTTPCKDDNFKSFQVTNDKISTAAHMDDIKPTNEKNGTTRCKDDNFKSTRLA